MMSTSSDKPSDATQPDFWNMRFEQTTIPWDKGGVPRAVQHYFQSIQPDASVQCLIPGCGNGYEVAYLSELGWDVMAIDFASSAVASAHTIQPLWRDRIIEADFFYYQPSKSVGIIYERAFFCALPPKWRSKIVRRWAELLPVDGLLIGFFYVVDQAQPTKKGPPFLIDQSELTKMMSPHFECVDDQAVEDSIAIFSGKERWQVWRRIESIVISADAQRCSEVIAV